MQQLLITHYQRKKKGGELKGRNKKLACSSGHAMNHHTSGARSTGIKRIIRDSAAELKSVEI